MQHIEGTRYLAAAWQGSVFFCDIRIVVKRCDTMAQGQQMGYLPIRILGGTPVMRPLYSSRPAAYAFVGTDQWDYSSIRD